MYLEVCSGHRKDMLALHSAELRKNIYMKQFLALQMHYVVSKKANDIS
ncbi:hypothetical protein PMI08_03988 [Brevibacillus sp. CF112]|nr:hypothetical protein PMI08_03988 [Brevibacillus sp. CF112]